MTTSLDQRGQAVGLRVDVHTAWTTLEPLAPQWNALLAASASDTIFLTAEWLQVWWRAYGGGRPLMILTVRDGQDLIGVAPFFVDTLRRLGRSCSYLRLVGDGSWDSDYLDCISLPGREGEVMAAVVEALERRGQDWRWLDLHPVPETSPCLAALTDVLGRRGWRMARTTIPCLTLSLPGQWTDYLQSLSPRVRSKVRAGLTFIDQQAGAPPRALARPDDVDPWLDLLFELHTRRWQGDGQPGVFRNPAKRAFYREFTRVALSRGWLAFHRLDWGERPLALQYGFAYRDRFYLLQEGYDPDFASVRAGVALRGWLMRHWIEQGAQEYDFLAGASPYKLEWGAQEKQSLRLVASPPASAWLALDVVGYADQLRSGIRKALPSSLLDVRRHVAEWGARRRWAPADSPGTGRFGWAIAKASSTLYAGRGLGRLAGRLAGTYALRPAGQRPRLVKRRDSGVAQILVYGRVSDDGDAFLPAITPAAFTRQIEYLARTLPVVSLDDVAGGQWEDQRSTGVVAITLDGGYRDTFTQALPVLTRLGVPATIFVPTQSLDSGELPWPDQVRLAFKLTTRTRLDLGALGGPAGSLDPGAHRLAVLAATLAWLRSLEPTAWCRAVTELYRTLGLSAAPTLRNHMLTWDDAKRVRAAGFTVGAQSATFPVLSSVTGERLTSETAGARQALERRLRSPVHHFAYPFGGPEDVTPAVRAALEAAGFVSAVTRLDGVVTPGADRWQLRRQDLSACDPAMFPLALDWARLSGEE